MKQVIVRTDAYAKHVFWVLCDDQRVWGGCAPQTPQNGPSAQDELRTKSGRHRDEIRLKSCRSSWGTSSAGRRITKHCPTWSEHRLKSCHPSWGRAPLGEKIPNNYPNWSEVDSSGGSQPPWYNLNSGWIWVDFWMDLGRILGGFSNLFRWISLFFLQSARSIRSGSGLAQGPWWSCGFPCPASHQVPGKIRSISVFLGFATYPAQDPRTLDLVIHCLLGQIQDPWSYSSVLLAAFWL